MGWHTYVNLNLQEIWSFCKAHIQYYMVALAHKFEFTASNIKFQSIRPLRLGRLLAVAMAVIIIGWLTTIHGLSKVLKSKNYGSGKEHQTLKVI